MKIHLIGVAGTGMGAFAGLLKQAGHDVRGSDENVYPPMSDKLKDWGIEVRTPYAAQNLEPPVDLVVVGNVVKKDNVEATAARDGKLNQASFPETLGKLFLDERNAVVVAGTHGKTTTTSLIAWTLHKTKRDPGWLVGGIPLGLDESFRLGAPGKRSPFVVEGDEYDTAYFDKGPKFLHYRPRQLLCTSLEYDHADIYPSVDAIVARFAELMSLVPDDGHIVLCAEEKHLMKARAQAAVKARITTYGRGGAYDASNIIEDERGIRFTVTLGAHTTGMMSGFGGDEGEVFLPMSGRHNVLNALGAYAILAGIGLVHDEIALGFETFPGVKRRMEERGEADGCVVVDDFAHHPTAVRSTLDGAKKRYPGRALWALFEPRSATSCRKIFQEDYARAFDAADRVLLAPPGRTLDPTVALDVPKLAADVSARGHPATACASLEEMVRITARDCPKGAVLLCMSNGAFGGIHEKLVAALAHRTGTGAGTGAGT
jgi:UDP-N-acetylmuramate: L-alanyl-gamma-D-glutamyl-meso-diaminopimelate ligase